MAITGKKISELDEASVNALKTVLGGIPGINITLFEDESTE